MKSSVSPGKGAFHSKWLRLNIIFLYLVLGTGVVISLFPFYWMIIAATHASGDIFSIPPKFWFGNNFFNNLQGLDATVNIKRVFLNSLGISTVYSFLAVFLSSLAGYTFAKYEFYGKRVLFAVVMLTMMLPYQATLVPLFRIINDMGWGNTYQAVILPTLANAFGIFLMRQNMLAFPDSLIESARIDGCGEFRIFWSIVLPTMKPAIAALTIYMFMFQWNNFMWPLVILNSKDMYTLPLALSSLVGMSRIDYGQIMVGSTISTLPIIIVFLFLQREFISGILGGAVKE